ncbi:phytoene desaturase [Bacillus coahuilensis m2-6]|uniref:phytoene desaturase family protein n=1 Tax=Bacillus coahuilensis TaxID=408580 RepID=UPI00075010AE|nr:phytoene desaturase family protein [Bacillus coahuilensis]KUP08263.1 phytoene desaturase [Bacillus coahuilensis m2-6]
MKSNKKVIVIGGGLAGMSTAMRLADQYDVTIVEKGERLGGKLNKRSGKGYSFDTGPSILTMPWVLEKLFASAGRNLEDYLTISRVEPGWRAFYEDGKTLDMSADLPTMLEELRKVSESDAKNFLQYLQYTSKMYDLCMKSFYNKSISGIQDLRAIHDVRELLQMDPLKTMDSINKKYFKSKHVQQLFNFLIMYIGSSPYHAPAILSQLAHVQLGIGVHYVQGGMYEIARAMEKVLKEKNVNLILETKVSRIMTSGRRTTGIITDQGKRIDADIIVSNLEAIPCYETLLPKERKNEVALEDLQKFQPTVSGLVLLLGINRKYEQLAHHNFFFSNDPKKEFDQIFNKKQLADDPTVYIGISSKSDHTQAPEGKENFFILTHVPPLKKGEDWSIYRDQYRENVFSKLERMGLDDIREHIEFEHQFIPNDIQELYGSNGGSIYGVVTDRKLNGGFKIPNQSKEYDNLYFVGGSTHPGGGVPMVTLSGQLTADLIEEIEGLKDQEQDQHAG